VVDGDSVLDVVVVVTPNSDRSEPLMSSLSRQEKIRVHALNAVMLRSSAEVATSTYKFDQEFSHYVYSRLLRPGEIGCSISNTLARKSIARLENGGLILEDDARVVDMKKLVSTSMDFLNQFQGTSAVLSFYWTENPNYVSGLHSSMKMLRHFGHPPYTVAYALTKEAANRLVESNTPARFLADWPICKVKFFVSLEDIVRHGDDQTTSVINVELTDLEQNRLGILRRAAIYSGIYFFCNRHARFAFRDFIQFLWKPRILFHLNQIWLWSAFRLHKERK